MDTDIRVKLSVEDQQKATELEGKINSLRSSVAALDAQMKADPFGAFTAGPQIKSLTADLERYQRQLDSILSGKKNKFDTGSLLQGGRILQDVQYGLTGVTNNLVEIAPALGIAAVAFEVLSKNAESVAAAIGQWKDGLDSSQQGLKDNLTIIQEVVGVMDFSKKNIAKGFGGFLADFFPEISGIPAFGRIIKGDPEADRDKAAAAEAAKEIDKIQGAADKDRITGLRATVENEGGGRIFRGILEGDLPKEEARTMARNFQDALTTGDAGLVRSIQDRLREVGRGELAEQVEFNRPSAVQARREEEQKRKADEKELEDRRKAAEKADRDLIRQLEQDGKANEEFGKQQMRQQEEDDKARRRGQMDQTQGRLKWLKTLQEREERPAQMFGDSLGFYNALLTAGTAKGDGLDKTNSYLEQQIKIAEQQLEALRNFPANLGP